jgi:NitT/TauT family transport system substrate-binding protein
MIDRRSFLALVSATTVGLAKAARAAGDEVELTVALAVDDANFNPTTSSVFQLAETFGYYRKHGVKVTFVALDGTPQAAAALQSGAVDVADISLDAVVRLRASNGLPLRGFVAVATGSPFLIAAKTDITRMEDLVGRSFAISDSGSLDHALTQAVLRSFGIPPDGPNFVAIGAPLVRIQALAVGQVDATSVSFGTYSSIDGKAENVHVLLPPKEFSSRAPALAKFVAAREETLDTKREAVQRFTNALIETARDMAANPEKWIAAATAARPDLDPEKVRATARSIADRWCVNGCMNPGKVDDSIAFVYANPDFQKVPVLAARDLVDLTFTTRALEVLGVDKGTGLDSRP